MAEESISSNVSVEVVSGYASVNGGVKLYYEIRSPKSSSMVKPPEENQQKMLMIMGAFATLKHFEEQAQFLVNHFGKKAAYNLQILTYDHRGIGKSKPAPRLKQTSRMLADDALSLINQIWGENCKIHVYGASLGGMVAQELAVKLIHAKRLSSLYLAVTSRGSYVRPMAIFGTGLWSALMPLLIKRDREKMVREVLLPASFSPDVLKDQGERFAEMWINDYDNWFAFSDREACACQTSAAASHYLPDDKARLIREANIPITVQIATKDKLIPPKKQRELANLLGAKTVIFDQGHMGDDSVKMELYEASVKHLENAMTIS